MEGTIRPSIRLTLEKEERFFGPGVADLLELVEEKGSIQGACSEMGMSYSKSWKIIKRAERELGYPLLSSHNGGTAGGKSELTEKGKWFLQQYREMDEALRRKMEAGDQTRPSMCFSRTCGFGCSLLQ